MTNDLTDDLNKERAATPAADLERQIMSPSVPKNEREWWAARHIEALEAKVGRLMGDIAKYRARLEVDHHFVSKGGGPLERVDVPYTSADADSYDGVFCRDETIKILEEEIAEIKADADRRVVDEREAIAQFVAQPPISLPTLASAIRSRSNATSEAGGYASSDHMLGCKSESEIGGGCDCGAVTSDGDYDAKVAAHTAKVCDSLRTQGLMFEPDAAQMVADELEATGKEVVGLDEGNLPIYAPHVPEGWQLVPKEPTPDMIEAARNTDFKVAAYRAMLSAAPRPLPAVGGDIERLCAIHHDAYEAAASARGWATNLDCRCSWADLPEANKDTMRAAMRVLLAELHREPQPVGDRNEG